MNHVFLYVAGAALIIHGLIEIAPLLFKSVGSSPQGQGMQKFIFEPLQNNLKVTTLVGGIFGVVRIIAALGIFLSLMWGWALGVIISIVTFVVLTLYLPWGIMDGILSGIALIGLLIGYFGGQRIP
jgi:hypothetical protein